MRLLPESVLCVMRNLRQEADSLLAQHRKLLPRYEEVSVGGAAIDPLSRGEALHTFLNSLGTMSPEDALKAAKDTSRLFISKHNERWNRDYVVQRSEEQDYNYLTSCYERIRPLYETSYLESTIDKIVETIPHRIWTEGNVWNGTHYRCPICLLLNAYGDRGEMKSALRNYYHEESKMAQMRWTDQMRADLLSLYIDKLKSMSEEEFWDQFDDIAEESHGKIEANHYQARLTIAYDSLLKRGIRTDESGLGLLSSMIEHAERCDIRVVEAKSVSDYLDRYYKRERRSPTLLGMYEDQYIKEGYINTSHYDNVTGSNIYWPDLPSDYWETAPEVREHRNLIDTIIGEPTIIIAGPQNEQWGNVQAIQDQPFIYVMYNGHGRNDPDDLQYLLDLLGREQLDERLSPFINSDLRVGYQERNENGVIVYVDGERMYEVDGVYRFHGNFLNYSHAFAIDTNHGPTIRAFVKAIEENTNRDWASIEPIPDVLTSREEKYYSVDSAVERWDEVDSGRDREQRVKSSKSGSESEQSRQSKPKVFRKKTAHVPTTIDDTDYLDDL